jgi:hypothetical protein
MFMSSPMHMARQQPSSGLLTSTSGSLPEDEERNQGKHRECHHGPRVQPEPGT